VVAGVAVAVSSGGNANVNSAAFGQNGTAAASASASASATAAATTTATAAAAAANVNCDIVVPANPLTAAGLATPYQLTGPNGMTPAASGCTMANAAALGAFVQATVLDPATGALSVYNPLVITQGTTAAVAPVTPTLPAGAVVTIDFGFNGTGLTLVGANGTALTSGNCVNGLNGSIFGQVAMCNGPTFFADAKTAETNGLLKVPAPGTSAKITVSAVNAGSGTTCPTTHNFNMIDQDQSDNVTALYLLNPTTGQTAVDTTANAANMPNATVEANGSDDALLDLFLDPTLGCTPFEAPDLGNNNAMGTSQALNELSSEANPPTPEALVPETDEMVLVNGAASTTKDNLYRAQLGMAPESAAQTADTPAMYCQNMVNIQTPFLQANQTVLATGATPVAATGNNLFTFLANRLSMSFTNLNCGNFGLTNPVTVTLDGNGVATAATFNTAQQTATNTAATAAAPTTGAATGAATATAAKTGATRQRVGRPGHQLMNPSGM
jgi:hypothetical protein